jgi:putative ABC transport system permease protein
LLAATVRELYVSSTPGDIVLTGSVVLEAFAAAMVMAIVSALRPAWEAAQVAPVEAMARGRRDYQARARSATSLAAAAVIALLAAWAASRDAVDGMPLFGYAACFLLIAAGALCVPALTRAICGLIAGLARKAIGAEGLLATRSLAASLGRTSVLVAALSTAIAMMISVGIMVGSFRQTVTLWMESQLRADLYLRPAGAGGAGRFPVMAADIANAIERLTEVADVDRFRLYEIEYGGLPALLGGGQTEVIARHGRVALLDASRREEVLRRLPQGDYCIVSEPFANKHHVSAGNALSLRLGSRDVTLEVLGVYYDYSNERGYVIVDRGTLLRYLPDPALSNLAVYLKPGVTLEAGRAAVEQVLAGRSVVVQTNRVLRQAALDVFDRTFAITWALEAIAIFVAVLGVTGALMALVIDRRRELGLLRFLGASAGQIRRLLVCEASILGLVANAAGLGLGAVLSLILIKVINRQSFGWTIQFHWPAGLLLAALTAIYLATIAASLWPARAAVRMNPIEVIHEE